MCFDANTLGLILREQIRNDVEEAQQENSSVFTTCEDQVPGLSLFCMKFYENAIEITDGEPVSVKPFHSICVEHTEFRKDSVVLFDGPLNSSPLKFAFSYDRIELR